MKPFTQFSNTVQSSFTPVFVSGSPRSGTTVCHALICTSHEVNDYVPESSFLTGVLNNLITSLNNEIHNVDLFGSKADFFDFGTEAVSQLLVHLWIRLKSPKLLCLKDPLMFLHFDWLHKVYPHVRYIFTFRDPVETISSRVTVDHKAGVLIDEAQLQKHSKELKFNYDFALKLHQTTSDRLLLINYREIIDGSAPQKINTFLNLTDIDVGTLWESQFTKQKQRKTTEWTTEKYGDPIGSTEKTPIVLSRSEQLIVERLCSESYSKLCGRLK